jgi:peptidyl-prolyl cis-trans isomerase SurA
MKFVAFLGYQALLLVCLLAGTPGPAQAQDPEVLDEIVAVVGGDVLLRSDVDGVVYGLMQQRSLPYSDELWMQALQELIDQKVLAVHAQRDTTIIVTDDQVNQALDQRIDQLTRQVGSQQRLEEMYGQTVLQIKADMRDDFRERLLADQFRNRRVSQIRVTPSEVNDWFRQFPTDSLPTLPEIVRLAHVVRYPKPSEAAQREALEIVSAIRDSVVTGGAPFEEMARRFSDDAGSAAQGGRIADIQLGDLVPEFSAMAARLTPGEISQPFRTTFGYHILRVNERRGDVVDFNHVLIQVDESTADPTAAIAFLSTIRDSILVRGAPFEIMARRHSEEAFSSELGGRVVDPSSGERDLFLEALGPTWQQTLDTLEVDEISHPAEVELLDGSRAYHIVHLQRRVPPHRVDILTDYERIEQLALQAKRTVELRDWLSQLRENVYVELRGKAARLEAQRGAAPGGLSQRTR